MISAQPRFSAQAPGLVQGCSASTESAPDSSIAGRPSRGPSGRPSLGQGGALQGCCPRAPTVAPAFRSAAAKAAVSSSVDVVVAAMAATSWSGVRPKLR